MNLGLCLGVAIGTAPDEGMVAEPNPNLLLWTEEFDNATWTKSGGVTVTADVEAGAMGGLADRVTSAALNESIGQTSTTAAAAGATVTADVVVSASYAREFVTGSFDGQDYVFSVFIKGGDAGSDLRLSLGRSGGFLRVSVIDRTDGMVWVAWGAKLETGTTPTAYVKREGT